MPSVNIDISQWKHLQNLKLSDVHFYVHHSLDLLLGSEFFTEILKGSKVLEEKGIRILKDFAEVNFDKFPRASKAILRNSYVDDIFARHDSVESALALQSDIIGLLGSGGLNWENGQVTELNCCPLFQLQMFKFILTKPNLIL
ncbi:hypothetical protein HHI36_015462 [Cryptolaemus montrouzieri]|uniref:Uncharacterized protein n=1 Tax=Cryptolaemus montrouzieri TaxID=559131 RepID=A0ABD2N5Y5_9CUCU